MPPRLLGPHHFTGVTADVTTNVDFWCRVMGLRFVKNTLNFETTFRYHTYFGDEEGNPGSVVTFLEFKELPRGRPGRGDIQRIVLRVPSYDSLEFWMDRLIGEQVLSELLRLDPTQPQSLVFEDPEGHGVELMVSDTPDKPLTADADDIPAEHRIGGIEGARSFATVEDQLAVTEHIGFRQDGTRLVLDGEKGSARWYFSPPPDRPSNDTHVGVWHHYAFGAGDHDELQAMRDYANDGPIPYTAVFDHYFFDSCYTMSPAGRIELCTSGPGFQLDESLEELGNRLSLSPRTEPLRAKLERELTPIVNPRPRTKRDEVKGVPAEAGGDESVPGADGGGVESATVR
ncbi:MAG TPA: VOC family protein [Solirubrobacteraceae bacterium]|nr:VOC family protein [Solirubrobacteraceae bacterium]